MPKTTYKITNIEDQPGRTGNPCCSVEYSNGSEEKTGSCIVFLNHEYKDGKFIKRICPDGSEFDYSKYDFETPVRSIVGVYNGVEDYIEQEFRRMFQEQREKQGW